MSDSREIEEAARTIAEAHALLIGAGAGMGVDSGLPDFRGDKGFWKRYAPLQRLHWWRTAGNERINDMPPVIGAYLPVCCFQGSTEPLLAYHLDSRFLLPKKCSDCQFAHEGHCIRASEGEERPETSEESLRIFRHLALDFGPCGVPDIEDITSRRFPNGIMCWVPAKCADCELLSEDLECKRYWAEYQLSCSLDFGMMTEDSARALLQEKSAG